jgi:hypothetical protein
MYYYFLLPITGIHFFPDKTIFFILKFRTGLKFEVTPSLCPVHTPRNPSLAFSFTVDKNSFKKLFRILKFKGCTSLKILRG